MRLTLTAALSLLAGCASVSRPPGGPEDHAPPEIVSISIDTNATNVTAGKMEVIFDEVIAERPTGGASTLQGAATLENVVLISPRTGATKVSWHRDRITIEAKGGFKPNTAYRITVLPGIADIRGNVRKEGFSRVFSTGATLPPYSIIGRVFDWQTGNPALATVQAVLNAGTKDSLIYIGIADSSGQFDVGPLGTGKYLMRGFIDADNSQTIGPLEKWDTTTVEVTDHRPVVELLAIQRDTAPIGVQRVEVRDSTRLRVQLDKPFDPRMPLQASFVILKRADSSVVPIARVITESAAKPDSVPRRDTTARPAPPALPSILETVSTRPPVAKPSLPSPQQTIIVELAPGGAVKPESTYVITLSGIRNLVGRTGTSSYEFRVPKPAPPPTVKPPPTHQPTNPPSLR